MKERERVQAIKNKSRGNKYIETKYGTFKKWRHKKVRIFFKWKKYIYKLNRWET